MNPADKVTCGGRVYLVGRVAASRRITRLGHSCALHVGYDREPDGRVRLVTRL